MSRLTHDEQADILDRVARDPIVQAMDRLRLALHRLVDWPFSKKRQSAFFAAWEDVNNQYINRLMGMTGTMIVGPVERLHDEQGQMRDTQERQATRMGRIEKRIDDLRLELEALRVAREQGA